MANHHTTAPPAYEKASDMEDGHIDSTYHDHIFAAPAYQEKTPLLRRPSHVIAYGT